MNIFRSNRLEVLIRALGALVRQPMADPLEPELIVVQSLGMERWVAMELARQHGVWALPEFPFPRALVERLLRSRPGAPKAWELGLLPWVVARCLPPLLARAEFEPLRRYLHGQPGGDGDARRRLELSTSIAATFDQYAVYRPELVLDWDRGGAEGIDRDEDRWQPHLWRAVGDVLGREGHFAARARAFLAEPGEGPVPGLPPRVHLFALSSLPPLFVDLLVALAARIEVTLYLPSPSEEYWADIRRRPGAREHEVIGNPLLASLSRVGRDLQRVLLDRAPEAAEHPFYVDPLDGVDEADEATLGTRLTVLQRDVLRLRHRAPQLGGPRDGDAPPLALEDDSLTFSSAHSPTREVEVLRDRLLALFEADPSLGARDVCVMTPDIERFAPSIEAVFGTSEREPGSIPFRIADRDPRRSNPVMEGLSALLALLRGRLEAGAVLDLLARPLVAARFGFTPEDPDALRALVEALAVAWGLDAAHRQAVGQPDFAEGSWRFGLDRLLLGHALPGGDRRLFHGVLPWDDMEGAAAARVGRLSQLVETLATARQEQEAPRPAAEQAAMLQTWLDRFFREDDASADAMRLTRAAITALGRSATEAGFNEALPLQVFAQQLEAGQDAEGAPTGFLTRGVTFCALKPIRSIPFRVIALLGLDDGAFPRLDRGAGYDLIRRSPRAGDRSVREDDRQLFLEAVLSAREHLHVSWCGQDTADGSKRPPSPVVSELLDVLRDSFTPPPVVVEHPLQPWSRRAYDGEAPALHSFDPRWSAAAEALTRPRASLGPFTPSLLPAEAPGPVVRLEELIRFFDNPARAWLQTVLGVHLPEPLPPLPDREPLELDALERWAMGDALLGLVLDDVPWETAVALVRARGHLPAGVPGAIDVEGVERGVTRLAAQVRAARGREARPPVELDARWPELPRLQGRLAEQWAGGQVLHHWSRLSGKRLLRAWIRHLARAAAGGPGVVTHLIGRPAEGVGTSALAFGPVADPAARLAELLGLFLRGQREPLPFEPDLGWAALRALEGCRDPDAARSEARSEFLKQVKDRPELRLAFRGRDPWAPLPGGAEAEGLIRVVFGPLQAALGGAD